MQADAGGDLLRDGHAALAAADWNTARSCFERAGDSAEALDGLSRALHFLGDYERSIELTERAFALYRNEGRDVEASVLARWLAFLHGGVRGNMAVGSGWMARAERLLEGVGEHVEHGYLALDQAPFTDDPQERETQAVAALGIARRFGDRDLEFGALALLGESYVASGRIAEGMRMVDEAMAAVAGGEVVAITSISDIYCRLLGACEQAGDARRAEEWMASADGFAAWRDFVGPICRLHYGGVLIQVGRWGEAEEQLLAAIRMLEQGYRGMSGFPVSRLAELRLRQGRLDEAERLLEGNESSPRARRVLAGVAFGRGDIALAEELARLCLDASGVADRACVPVLELLVELQIGRGDTRAAAAMAEKLAALADSGDDKRIAACAELAAGRVQAAEGSGHATARLQAALEQLAALELPFEAGRAQLALAQALAREAPEAAVAEARLALKAFERLGAARDADAAAGLLRRLGAPGRAWPRNYGPLTKRETEVLALLAAGLSNAEIGKRLFISPRTAEHHVASILSKLSLRSRAEAAAYAAREAPAEPVSQ